MSELSNIVLALIDETPYFAAIAIVYMIGKFGYKHFLIKYKDVFKLKFDK